MNNKKLSPIQVSGIAFLIAGAVGVCAIAGIGLFAPLLPNSGGAIEFISTATCPAAIIVGLLAYFSAKNSQAN